MISFAGINPNPVFFWDLRFLRHLVILLICLFDLSLKARYTRVTWFQARTWIAKSCESGTQIKTADFNRESYKFQIPCKTLSFSKRLSAVSFVNTDAESTGWGIKPVSAEWPFQWLHPLRFTQPLRKATRFLSPAVTSNACIVKIGPYPNIRIMQPLSEDIFSLPNWQENVSIN